MTAPSSKVVTCSGILKHAMARTDRRKRVGTTLPCYLQTEHIAIPGTPVQVDSFAVHCWDGDGIDVPLEIISQLAEVNGLLVPPAITVHDGNRVRCRFPGIDCPEIADVYSLKSRSESESQWTTQFTYEAGIQSLRCLRHLIQEADKLFLSLPLNCRHTSGGSLPVAAYGRASIELWYSTHGSERQRSVSIALLANGVAFVDERYSPPLSAYAIEKWARDERVGFFRFPSAATATGSTLMPWIRRQHRNETETEMAMDDEKGKRGELYPASRLHPGMTGCACDTGTTEI